MFLNIQEVALRYRVGTSTIRRQIANGTFPEPHRIGRQMRWRVADLEAWENSQHITNHPNSAAEPATT